MTEETINPHSLLDCLKQINLRTSVTSWKNEILPEINMIM